MSGAGDFTYTPSLGEFRYKGILWNQYTTVDILKEIERFQFLPSDIIVNTFPRSGTTLTQEIVWHIKNKDTVVRGAKYGDIDKRFPFLEYNSKFDQPDEPYPVHVVEQQAASGGAPFRLIKTHCPWSFIGPALTNGGPHRPPPPRCIVVFRNPRDVCVSLYHFYRGMQLFGPWPGGWDEFLEMFVRGLTKCGSWLDWQRDWWTELGLTRMGQAPVATTSRSGLPVLFFSFEMLVKSPRAAVLAIAEFLDEALSEQQLEVVLHNSAFRQMASNEELNLQDKLTGFRFIRNGQVGNWQQHFTEQQAARFHELVERPMESRGVVFEYR